MPILRVYADTTLKEQKELRGEITTIGRASDNDIVLDDPAVSAHHAEILRRNGTYLLCDKESRNGVFVNGKRVNQHELQYWDEIRIADHVLKFMALARLPGESAQDEQEGERSEDQSATVEIDLASIADLADIKRARNELFVEVMEPKGEVTRLLLDNPIFRIGRARDCELRVRGWLAPGVAAEIQRRGDGCYIVPHWRGKVTVADMPIKQARRLSDNDTIKVRGLSLTFFNRPLPKS